MASIHKQLLAAGAVVAGTGLLWGALKPTKTAKRTKTEGSLDEQLAELRRQWEAAGQGQVFRFMEKLTRAEKMELLESVKSVDVDQTNTNYASIALHEDETKGDEISPFTGETKIQATASQEEKGSWRKLALTAVAQGQVGVLLMAGGQGTRLGSSEPKGMYDINLPSGKSLFQLQAERLLKLMALAARENQKALKDVALPWYIMTSEATHQPTMDFFKKMHFFGLRESSIFFFKQNRAACLTNDGKIMLESKSRIAQSPNGNGGIYGSLFSSGALNHMKENGVEYIHCYGVDNVLVKIADPYFMGYSIQSKADSVNKICLKEHPHEKVGVMCNRGGKPGVVEYSDISKEMAEMRDADGKLVYSAANIAMHYFTVSFLDQVASTNKKWLPFHVAKKAIPAVTEAGEIVKPSSPNGIKIEMFIFDVFAYSKAINCFACTRDDEFAPLKNKPGPLNQSIVGGSPDSARLALSAYHIKLVEAAGGTVNKSSEDRNAVLEISPLLSYDGEDLEKIVKGKTYDLPIHLVEE